MRSLPSSVLDLTGIKGNTYNATRVYFYSQKMSTRSRKLPNEEADRLAIKQELKARLHENALKLYFRKEPLDEWTNICSHISISYLRPNRSPVSCNLELTIHLINKSFYGFLAIYLST